ncbi:MAG: alpha-amylase [Leptolyngbya sp. SIO4C1]|nr:alpha-amylase [Leptolyngbya sp. SIO4C1]
MAEGIEFELWAPYNERALLVGEFLEDQTVAMQKASDGYFRTTVELADGRYAYKFRVQSKSDFALDAWVEIVDPYATRVDEIEQSAIALVKDGQRIVDDYVWQHEAAELPSNESLVIYEMLVQDFAGEPSGTFQAVIERLDYLKSLGVNALELMPVQACPGETGWGYNTRHYFALRSDYGEPSDFKQLVDACHARGMRVILDVVLNHSEAESPLTQIDYSYWYRQEPKDPDNSWGPEFDYDHYDEHLDSYPARAFMQAVINFWITEYHIDGLRFDAVKQIANPEFLNWLTDQAGQTAQPKTFYSIGERIPEKPALSVYSGPMDGCWRDSFHHTCLPLLLGKGIAFDQLKQLVDITQSGYQSAIDAINFITSHDHGHLMADLAAADVFDQAAFKRAKLGAALVLTAMGVPMIWMGEEFGEYKEKTLDPAPLDWSLLDSPPNAELLDYYQGLVNLRTANAALQSSNLAFLHENPDDCVLGYVRWHELGSQVVVIVNASNRYIANYEIDQLPEDGGWHEWTKDYDVQVEGGRLVIDLPEYEAQVLVWSA